MLFVFCTLWPRFYIMLFVKTLCLKVMKTTMSAAIVCSAVCISDVINNAGIGSKVIKYIMSQPFLLFFGEERTKVAAPWRAQIRSKKVVLLYKEWSPKWSTQMKNVCILHGWVGKSFWFTYKINRHVCHCGCHHLYHHHHHYCHQSGVLKQLWVHLPG